MQNLDHEVQISASAIVTLSFAKSLLISKAVLNKLQNIVKMCQFLSQLLLSFGTLIILTVFSFATDYACVVHNNEEAFIGFTKSPSYIQSISDGLYFSVVTFSTVGYGDMAPISSPAKTIVVFEIGMSFLIIFFALANVNKIHTDEN